MTPQHFQAEINRMASVFTPAAFAKERRDLIWKECGNLSDDVFTRIVNRLIGECRQAPLVPDFREAAAYERERIWEAQKVIPLRTPEGENWRCGICRGSGAVLARRKGAPMAGPYAFKCGCSIGSRDMRALPRWDSNLLNAYEVCS